MGGFKLFLPSKTPYLPPSAVRPPGQQHLVGVPGLIFSSSTPSKTAAMKRTKGPLGGLMAWFRHRACRRNDRSRWRASAYARHSRGSRDLIRAQNHNGLCFPAVATLASLHQVAGNNIRIMRIRWPRLFISSQLVTGLTNPAQQEAALPDAHVCSGLRVDRQHGIIVDTVIEAACA